MKLFARLGLIVAAGAMQLIWCTASAPAALQMASGLRDVVPNGAIADCNTKAQAALNAHLHSVGEIGTTGQWLAYGPPDSSGQERAAAAINCFPVGAGYVVTFTCAAEIPPNLFNPADLCTDLEATFSGKAAPAPLATPTPVPTGCSTTNLVGKWKKDGTDMTMIFDPNGGFEDSQGVSGGWALTGTTVTLEYYGQETLTLSPDGKRMSGRGGSYTREC